MRNIFLGGRNMMSRTVFPFWPPCISYATTVTEIGAVCERKKFGKAAAGVSGTNLNLGPRRDEKLKLSIDSLMMVAR